MWDARSIKENITMTDVFLRYGFTPNRAGFVVCPFHREKTPSLKAYREGRAWHCFGCGASGSVIDFVMLLFDLSFSQAVVRIQNDFGFGSGNARDALEQTQWRRRQRDKRREEEQEARAYQALWSRYALFDRFLINHVPDETSAGGFGAVMGEMEYLWWRIVERNEAGDRRGSLG